jgi:tRNA (guanine-N7-)-methyltransferase
VRTFVHQHIPSTVVRASATMLLAPDAASLWSAVFGNTRPVFVEVGPGRGEFLLRSAREDPAHNYFAIERSRARVREIERTLSKRRGLANLRVINADAACTLALLPDACVAGYFVLFPDPWWKVRHHRRRLVTPEFVATLRRTLAPGGLIHLATDVPGYFDIAQECLNRDTGLELIEAGPSPAPPTSFSRKAQRLGTPIYRSVHRRRETSN